VNWFKRAILKSKFFFSIANYLKAELSSVFILSKCLALVGGHCGASDMAIYFINSQYEHLHIFKKGYY
jgi:hypothetical protein